jgi:hypothetical protein
MLKQIFVLVILFNLSTKPAHAYLDPGSGSYMIQMLIAGAVGGSLFVKTFWVKIKNLLGKKKDENKGE